MKTTKLGRNLVLWMALGDGTLNANGYLSIRHSIKQKEYLEWKRKILKENGIAVSEIYYVNNNGYGGYEFRTKSYDFIRVWRRRLYKPSKKIYQKSILNSIESLGLYIWYLDDGSLTKKKENNQVVANILYLNIQVEQNQNQIIIDWFFEKFHIKFYQNKDHKYYRLLCGTKEARKFLSIISKYKNEVPSMIYKFDIKPEPATR